MRDAPRQRRTFLHLDADDDTFPAPQGPYNQLYSFTLSAVQHNPTQPKHPFFLLLLLGKQIIMKSSSSAKATMSTTRRGLYATATMTLLVKLLVVLAMLMLALLLHVEIVQAATTTSAVRFGWFNVRFLFGLSPIVLCALLHIYCRCV